MAADCDSRFSQTACCLRTGELSSTFANLVTKAPRYGRREDAAPPAILQNIHLYPTAVSRIILDFPLDPISNGSH
jgi:hypothetical protein